MADTKNTPLMENEYVKELLAVMKANNMPGVKDLLAVIGQVGVMEKQLDTMITELQGIRRELAEAQKHNHPIKTVLQGAVANTQGQILDLRDKLGELKDKIIEGCKNALSAFKEKGLSALRNIASFFKVRPLLESMRDNLDNGIKQNEATIAKIETMSADYHEAGRHLKNIVRAMSGREPVQEAKPVGKIAKVMQAPSRSKLSIRMNMRKNIAAALGAVERLEKTERKPPVMETVNKLNEQIARAERDAPARERRPVAHDGR